MIALIAAGTLVMNRRDDIALAAITTAVILITAANNPEETWQQPLLRLLDTIIGVAVGIACKWLVSFVFYRLVGQTVR